MRDDATLLREFVQSRSNPAFAELVQHHVDAVYSSALRRLNGDAHLAEDVTQQVFVSLARKASSLMNHPQLLGWLLLATRHESAKAVRTEQRRRQREQETAVMAQMNEERITTSEWAQIARLLDAELDRLNESDRSALLLRFFERLSFAAVGQRLGASEDAARMRVERALAKLRSRLSARGATTSSGLLASALSSHAVQSAPAALASAASSAAVSAVGSVTGSAALIQLMVTSKFSVAAASIALVCCLGGAAYQLQQRADAAEALRAEQAASDATRSALHRTSVATIAAQPRPSATLANAAPASRAAVPSGAIATAGAQDPKRVGDALLTRHPEVRAALQSFFDGLVDEQYGELFDALHLPPAQADRLRALMRRGKSYGQSLGPDGPWIELIPEPPPSTEELNRILVETIPASQIQVFAAYLGSMTARLKTETVAAAVAQIDPLTPAQVQQLTSFFRSAAVSGGLAGAVDWERVTTDATPLLSSDQLLTLGALQKNAALSAAIEAQKAALARSAP